MSIGDTFDKMFKLQTGGLSVRRPLLMLGENGGPEVCAFVDDAEMDVFKIDFCPEGMVSLIPGDMKWIMLDARNLRIIANMARDADKIWTMLEAFQDENGDWVGWEHLAANATELEKAKLSDSPLVFGTS